MKDVSEGGDESRRGVEERDMSLMTKQFELFSQVKTLSVFFL